jgi:hypothetical protein
VNCVPVNGLQLTSIDSPDTSKKQASTKSAKSASHTSKATCLRSTGMSGRRPRCRLVEMEALCGVGLQADMRVLGQQFGGETSGS